jgi:small subunit ribosomal protein S6
MLHYELLYIIPNKFTEEELPAVQEKIKQLLAKFNLQITKEESLGKRKLAYPIKKSFHGYYQLVEFDAEGEVINNLDRELKLHEDVLRHQVVRLPHPWPKLVMPEEETASLPAFKTEPKKETGERKVSEKKREEAKKIKLEDLDQKLDDLIKSDII